MRISDWSSDVCSSDLWVVPPAVIAWLLWRGAETASLWAGGAYALYLVWFVLSWPARWSHRRALREAYRKAQERLGLLTMLYMTVSGLVLNPRHLRGLMDEMQARELLLPRSEEHTSELQSLMRLSYAVFCLKK